MTESNLLDLYDHYARNSTNSLLLEQPKGSIVQAGNSRRFGFFLNAEYGLIERVTASAGIAYFYTQHLDVGPNVALFTNSQPNTQKGFQDFTGNIKFRAYQYNGREITLAVSPYVGLILPVTHYDTSVDNPLGDGIAQVDLALALSAIIPSTRLFFNFDAVYRVREHKAVRVGNIWPAEFLRANPDFPASGSGGIIHDQVQAILEVGYFFTDWLSLRAVVKRTETLGGEDLTFSGMPLMMTAGLPKMSMFENSLAYDQDSLFVGGGPYWQVNEYFGVGATYVHAVWFKNFPNMKTVVLSLSFSPKVAKRPQPEPEVPVEGAAGEQGPVEGSPDQPAPAQP